MKAILALGSNESDPRRLVQRAVTAIASDIGHIAAISSEYLTRPWGFASHNDFVNIALTIDTELSAIGLLDATQEIERRLGRIHKSIDGKYSDRPIDIDIIDYEGMVTDTPRLTLPHPMIQSRNFVLYPLAEICPHWIHPVTRQAIAQLLITTTDRDKPNKYPDSKPYFSDKK